MGDDFSFPELYPPEAYMQRSRNNNNNNNTTTNHRNSSSNTTPALERQRNVSAVHTSVYGFDVYSIGLILDIALDYPGVCGGETMNTTSRTTTGTSSSPRLDPTAVDNTADTNTATVENSSSSSGCTLAHELVTFLLTPDPNQRPDTNAALDHPFFSLYS